MYSKDTDQEGEETEVILYKEKGNTDNGKDRIDVWTKETEIRSKGKGFRKKEFCPIDSKSF